MTALDTAYTLGRTGLRVTRLALGAMTFGSDWGWGADEAASRALFDRYLDAGGNFVDTADLYCGGESERMLGRFVADAGARDRLVIATKYGYSASLGGAPASANTGGNHRKNLVRAVEGSLARLGTDYIDLLWTHIWDRLTPVDEVARALDDLVRAGKVRYVGLSNAPAWYAARAQTLAELRGWEPIAALQLEYSLVERQLELEHADAAQHLGMGLVAWSPLGSGVLTGKYRPGGAGEGRLAVMKDSGNPVFDKLTPANFAILEVVEAVARELGRTPAQVALNWVATRPGVASVIVGA
ncbi:MAG: aldo/keto reductase, partial [Myxococcales bacterium]|nr:aldo/keto reductase [Myxococcales bacterium]